MILVKLKGSTSLYKIDKFITNFKNKYNNKKISIDIKLINIDCFVSIYKKQIYLMTVLEVIIVIEIIYWSYRLLSD